MENVTRRAVLGAGMAAAAEAATVKRVIKNGRIRQSLVFWCLNGTEWKWDVEKICTTAKEVPPSSFSPAFATEFDVVIAEDCVGASNSFAVCNRDLNAFTIPDGNSTRSTRIGGLSGGEGRILPFIAAASCRT